MSNKLLIAPSILSADFARLKEEAEAVKNAGADWLHVDVMDGHFVPNLTIGPVVIQSLSKASKLPLDVHLMITNPDAVVSQYIDAGATWLTVHQEASVHLHRTIHLIKSLGAKAGVSINPSTPVSMLEEILSEVDLVLVMSVNPGFGGQKFIDSSYKKISELAAIRGKRKLKFLISVDGGVDPTNSAKLVKAGANVLVAGSAIFKKKNYVSAISDLRKKK